MLTRQLQVERRTGKVLQSKNNVLPLCHATKPSCLSKKEFLKLTTDQRNGAIDNKHGQHPIAGAAT